MWSCAVLNFLNDICIMASKSDQCSFSGRSLGLLVKYRMANQHALISSPEHNRSELAWKSLCWMTFYHKRIPFHVKTENCHGKRAKLSAVQKEWKSHWMEIFNCKVKDNYNRQFVIAILLLCRFFCAPRIIVERDNGKNEIFNYSWREKGSWR